MSPASPHPGSMDASVRDGLKQELDAIRSSGLYKQERVLIGPQQRFVRVPGREPVLNLCANNYLGLANHPDIVAATHTALDQWGYGLSSVRFICGTQEPHKELERRISDFLGTDDTILYGSCFDANGGLFETILGAEDAVFSDALNHASIIDGIRLSKAKRYRYANNDMADLRKQLETAGPVRRRLIVTDGVFSMDGIVANLPALCDLAEEFGALLMVDDSHAVGFMGAQGRGTHEHHDVMGRVDILTGTLGKALGGASGGYTSGRSSIIELLRQRSRPYLFSNSVAPPIIGASLKVLDLLSENTDLRDRLAENTRFFRSGITDHGFNIVPGTHPIVPIMLGEAHVATEMAERLLDKGIYVIAFSFPVVPRDQARIRIQISAAHTREDLQFSLDQFAKVKKEMN